MKFRIYYPEQTALILSMILNNIHAPEEKFKSFKKYLEKEEDISCKLEVDKHKDSSVKTCSLSFYIGQRQLTLFGIFSDETSDLFMFMINYKGQPTVTVELHKENNHKNWDWPKPLYAKMLNKYMPIILHIFYASNSIRFIDNL